MEIEECLGQFKGLTRKMRAYPVAVADLNRLTQELIEHRGMTCDDVEVIAASYKGEFVFTGHRAHYSALLSAQPISWDLVRSCWVGSCNVQQAFISDSRRAHFTRDCLPGESPIPCYGRAALTW